MVFRDSSEKVCFPLPVALMRTRLLQCFGRFQHILPCKIGFQILHKSYALTYFEGDFLCNLSNGPFTRWNKQSTPEFSHQYMISMDIQQHFQSSVFISIVCILT